MKDGKKRSFLEELERPGFYKEATTIRDGLEKRAVAGLIALSTLAMARCMAAAKGDPDEALLAAHDYANEIRDWLLKSVQNGISVAVAHPDFLETRDKLNKIREQGL